MVDETGEATWQTNPCKVVAVPDNTPYCEAWNATYGMIFAGHGDVRTAVYDTDSQWLSLIQTTNGYYDRRAHISIQAHLMWQRAAAELGLWRVSIPNRVRLCTPAGLLTDPKNQWLWRCRNLFCPSDRYRDIVKWSKNLYAHMNGMVVTALTLTMMPKCGERSITIDQRRALQNALRCVTNNRQWTYGQSIIVPNYCAKQWGLKATLIALVADCILTAPKAIAGISTASWSRPVKATKKSIAALVASAGAYTPDILYRKNADGVAEMMKITQTLKLYSYGNTKKGRSYATNRLDDSSRFTSPAKDLAEQAGHPQRLIPQS